MATVLLLLLTPVRGEGQGLWTATSPTGAPFVRAATADATTVWTGSKMIVWGGSSALGLTNTGAIYDFATDTWAPVSTTGAPSARSRHAAVWTGSRMIVWGGQRGILDALSDGASYDPATDTWTAIAAAPLARYAHSAVWTGSRMIVWGGVDVDSGLGDSDLGASYNPATNTWTSLSTTNAPSPRHDHTALWTGSKMIVWGGGSNAGGVYDPTTNTWTAISAVGAPAAHGRHTAVWTGSKMIDWGGNLGQPLETGGLYDLATGTWSSISTTGAPSARIAHSAVWTGSKMIVWGGWTASGLTDTGGVYDPATDTWSGVTNVGAPPQRWLHAAHWTGTRMLVGGGEGTLDTGGTVALDTGGVYCVDSCPTADLHISNSNGLAFVAPGQPVTYTIVASNAGPSTANGALVQDVSPAGLTGVSWNCTASGGASCLGSGGAGDISRRVNLPAGGEVTFVATGTVSVGPPGALVNTATVSSPTLCPDPALANNSATDTDPILIPADVSVTKTDDQTFVVPGQAVTYVIVASNAGPNPVDVTVSDRVPASLLSPTWTCFATGGASCAPSGSGDIVDGIHLPVGGTATYTLSGTLSSNPPGLSNTVSVILQTGYGDPNGANNSATDTDVIVYGPTDFFTVTPCRVIDTRNPDGPTGGPSLAPGSTRVFPVTGGSCGIPSTATAVSVNLTAVGATAVGHLTLYRGDAPTAPLVSSVNFSAGQTRANNAVVPLAPDGTIKVKNGSAGPLHLVLDVNGYLQ